MQVIEWVLDHIAGGLIIAVILVLAEVFGLRRRLTALWDRRPWPRINRAPRTEAETRRLLAACPDGWEYLLLVGALYQQLARQEARYRDHDAGYVQLSDLVLPDEGIGERLQDEIERIRLVVSNWNALINGPAYMRAIGEPGEPGDAERIEHFADRLTSTYVGVMDWSARLRGAQVRDRYRRIVDILAHFADQPVAEYRAFVAEAVEKVDRVPAMLRDKKRKGVVELRLTLTLSIADDVTADFDAEMARLQH
jgi:hypothetical protein